MGEGGNSEGEEKKVNNEDFQGCTADGILFFDKKKTPPPPPPPPKKKHVYYRQAVGSWGAVRPAGKVRTGQQGLE